MLLWLILTAMTAAAAVYVAAPFLRPTGRQIAEQVYELQIFRDQLAEIDREAAAGSIEPAAADQARAEIKRRMLTADKALTDAQPARPLDAVGYKFALIAATACTVLGSTILYVYSGNPGLPAALPVAERAMSGTATSGDTASKAAAAPGLTDVNAMIAQLRGRLEANPNDAKGWAMLGWSYMSTGKYQEAVDGYRKAVSLDDKSANFQIGLADALIQQANGQVTPEAKSRIDTAISIDGKEPRALFLRGLGKSQGGDAKGAIEDWFAVLALAGPADPWSAEVRQQIETTAQQANIDVAGRLPAAPQPSTAATTTAATAAPANGPTQADVEAAQKLSESDRTAMIQGMVERLAQKLEASPRNLDGWIQLMRARKVMGDPSAAQAALKRAQTVFADSPPDLDRLKAAASELGL